MAVTHLGELLAQSVARFPERIALRVREGDEWKTTTYAEMSRQVDILAGTFVRNGLQHGDRIAIFSPNRPEWTIADFAGLSVGLIVTPVYHTSTPQQVAHVLRDSEARAIFVAGAEELAKVNEIRNEFPDLHVVCFDDVPGDDHINLSDRLAGPEDVRDELDRRKAAVKGDDIATLIYTSGTTGLPKGVALTHHAFVWQATAVLGFFTVEETDSSVCFLPLAHALERAWTFVVLSRGAMNTYVPDPRTVADLLPLAQPTLLVSVPKLYETVYKVANERAQSSKVKGAIFGWALGVGAKAQEAAAAGGIPPMLKAQLAIADKLVFKGVRNAIGGQKRVLACGGAPVRAEVEDFFRSCGVLISSGYGLTEAAPLISFNCPTGFRFGSAGRVVPGGELRIDDDGEILYRGENIMHSYWKKPVETAEAMDGEWLRTGDIGEIDADGFLFITDRNKDIIVTAGGKNIAPSAIEAELSSDPLIEYAVLLGDNRPCVTALIRPSLPGIEELAEQMKIKVEDARDLITHPHIVAELRKRVDAVSEHLPGYEKIREMTFIPDEFTLENGLLTPTMKVRRREVEKKFKDVVEGMYEKIRTRVR